MTNQQPTNNHTNQSFPIGPDLYQKLRLDNFKERLKKREIWINGPLTNSLVELLYVNLVELDTQTGDLPITVMINSTGGLFYESIVATDIMGTIRSPVRTIALANAVSGGFMLFMGGKERICHDYTNLMMHCAGFGAVGKAFGIKKAADYILYSMKKMARFFSIQTGGKASEEFWMSIFENEEDHWFEVEEAIKLGIVHRVVRRPELVAMQPREPYTWGLTSDVGNRIVQG